MFPANPEVAWLLMLEQLIFRTEAESRWLDHCETRLIRLSAAAAADTPATEPPPHPEPAPAPGPTPAPDPAPDPVPDPAPARSPSQGRRHST